MWETHGQKLTDDEILYLHMYRMIIEKGEDMGNHYEAIHGYRDERHERPINKQIGGDHYSKHNIQPIDVIREYSMDFFEGNALKYLLRYKEKNGIEDLLKCKDYIDMIIDNINTKESK